MIEFVKLREEHLDQVLRWRTQADVTRYMNTDIAFDMEQQKKWFASISKSETDRYWIISIKGRLVGVISLNAIDLANKKTSWGFYIGEEKYRMYGGVIPLYLYHYVFTKLELNKITAEVMVGNENVVKLNKVHGCREVGVYKEHIYKNGAFHDIILMELLRSDWEKKKKNHRYEAVFEV